MAVRVIPARKAGHAKVIYNTTTREADPVQVAAYCRVSTDNEEQESSYEAQIFHYTEFIHHHKGWLLAGIYADEGISGTETKNRNAFNQMIADCKDGKIDFVITKSISRFARNTLDCLKYIRMLKDLNIPILFEKENINTMDANGELLITIMASIAQQESASISQNVRMGQHYRMQQGKPNINAKSLGYRYAEDGTHLEIIPEHAIIIRRIFREFLDGASTGEIADHLSEDGIPTPTGKGQWRSDVVKRMLKNERYMGDLLLQKYYCKDFITKKRIRNNGEFPKYYVENAHDPIVPKEVWYRVQGEFLRREEDGFQKRYRKDMILGHKVICGQCGNHYSIFCSSTPQGPYWRCTGRSGSSSCSERILKQSTLFSAIISAFNFLPFVQKQLENDMGNREESRKLMSLIEHLTEEENSLLSLTGMDEKGGKQLADIRKRKNEAMRRKADLDLHDIRVKDLLLLIHDLQEETDSLWMPETWNDHVQRQLNEYEPFCKDTDDFFHRTNMHLHHGPMSEFHNEDAMRYLDHIGIHETSIAICFKAGIEIEITA